MKSLFDPPVVGEVQQRLMHLTELSGRKWGTMNPAQALAHCSAAMEMATGKSRPPRALIGRIIGRAIKSRVLSDEEQMRKNSPTTKILLVKDERNFAGERIRLSGLIDDFAGSSREGCTTHPHPFFGPLTADEWAVLMYKHLDHHLRQFGV